MRTLSITCALAATVLLVDAAAKPPQCSITNAKTSLTLLYENNLNLTDDANHVGAILLDPTSKQAAASACAVIGEKLLPKSVVEDHEDDFLHQLSYQSFAKRAGPNQLYWIEDVAVSVEHRQQKLEFHTNHRPPSHELPVLCTQSSTDGQPDAVATTSNKVKVPSQGNTYVGFRNLKSFRFQGIRYAKPPKRFEYTTLHEPHGQTIDATKYGDQCIQTGSGGSEDCLFLNIQTPYIPKAGSKKNLRPVLFWIHGGGFTGGAGSYGNSDGGQLASREDVVTVTMNYRLSTLGFLAVPGTKVTGNYGIADQQLALEWTLKNIENFGGDPKQITLNGGSAGACSVRVHLGSPKSIGKFQGAIAMSNLGGGQSLGLTGGNYATQYSNYPTIQGSYDLSSKLFSDAGCSAKNHEEQVACLKKLDAKTIINLPTVARYVVQDGTYVNTPELVVSKRGPQTAHVPVIFGIAADDGSSFCDYPKDGANEVEGIQQGLGISKSYAQSIIDSGLFPYYDSGNRTEDIFNVSQRVATDQQFRCIDQASAYAGAKTGAFKSAYFYETTRTACPGYNPENLACPAPEPGFPFGSPYEPYFRMHGADQAAGFGYLDVMRDQNDVYAIQMSLGYFGSFIRSGQPNPSAGYLKARGYSNILEATKKTGTWEAIKDASGPIRFLDWPSTRGKFVDVPQCAFLNYSINYYLD